MNDLMTRSFLNYVDLKKQAAKDLENAKPDLEMGHLDDFANEKDLFKFFEEVNLIKHEMEEIAYLLLDLQDLNEDSKKIQSSKAMKGIRDRINSDMLTILRKARSIRSRLEAMDKVDDGTNDLPVSCNVGRSAVDQTRIAVTNGLRARLREMMHEFQALREKILKDHKEGLKTRYSIVTGQEPSEEVVESMILGDGKERVFEGRGDLAVENKERHEALKEVQRSLNELHRVFLDMAVLVESQGDHEINDIEENVALGRTYINGGTNELYYAKQMKKRERNWCCWVGVFLVVLLVILVAVLSS